MITNPEQIPMEVKELFEQMVAEAQKKKIFYMGIDLDELESYQPLKKKDATFKKQLVLHAAQVGNNCYAEYQKNKEKLRNDVANNISNKLKEIFLRVNLGHTFEELMAIVDLAKEHFDGKASFDYWFPFGSVLKQFERILKKDGFTEEQQAKFSSLLDIEQNWHDAGNGKNTLKIKELIAQAKGKSIGEVEPVLLDETDQICQKINVQIAAFNANLKIEYYQLLAMFKKATQAKPAPKFQQEVDRIAQNVGNEHFAQTIKHWLKELKSVNVIVERKTESYVNHVTKQNQEYSYTTYTYLKESTLIFAKGLIWASEKYADREVIQILAELGEKSFKKIPSKGPLAMGLGNACIYVLSTLSLEGVSYLSRLKLRIRQASTQTLIENYIRTSAQTLGVTPSEIEDMATPSFGLENGKLEEEFEGYKAIISIESIGKAKLEWFKADGTPMKSVPSVVNENHKDSLKELKNDTTEIQKTLTVQRDRLDRAFTQDRVWTWEAFDAHYFSHGLMSFLTTKLIWIFEIDQKNVEVFYLNNQWVDLQEKPVDSNKANKIKLWHPVFSQTQEVLAWREFLAKNQIQQPLKQAYREIYLLTDAEINTRNYSNRMAAHVLKQHQFNSLAKIRGWKYSLLGAYDKGYDTEIAKIELPNNHRAEFWVQEIYADGEWNDSGIYNYVSTDQVRFYKNETQLNMIDVPPLLFSEAMRDVDLFVGVASVGNDPNWRDGGLQEFRTYWENYSFGDLSEVAKTRKQVLEKLIPRLKIAKQCTITDKFLVVKGSLRTYKIHMGSGNILMEPNDQYLCIVADRKSEDVGKNVFLPFEGDTVLSIIISKALLLAEDTKIKDGTITSQINR